MPRSGIAESYGSSNFSFLGTFLLFSIVAIPIYIPTNSVEAFLFPILAPEFIICRLFDDGYSDQCEVIPPCSFDTHFSDI